MLRKIRHLAHIKQRRSSSQASGLPQHLASQTPVPPSTGPASSEYNLLFKEALDEYRNALGKHKERTETDLTTHPIIVRLESCQSIEDVMAEFHKCTSEFDTFRNGKGKRNLMRKLYPIVTVILALRPTDTLGEGFGVMFPPANAILGAVGILLEAIKNVSESYDSLVELLGCVSSFLDRLKIYSNGPSITSMKPMLLKILTEVISILALATAEVKQSRLNKYVQKLLGDTTVEDALRKLNRLTSKEALTVEAETLDATYRLLKALDTLMQTGAVATDKLLAAISELDRHVANIGQIEKDINDMKRDAMGEKYRRWLSPPDPSTNHNTAVESHQDGTSTWFIEGDVLAEWKTTGSLLWIHGKPGSGKSILCSAVIEDINRTWLAQPDIILAYFYCDFRDTAKQHVRSILAHILVSIAANSDCAARILSELHSSNANGSHQPRHDALILCLHKMLEASSDHSIFIVIDALDECPESESKRRHVLQLIERIVKWRIQHVRICVTSRPEVDIRNTLEPLSPCSVALSNEMGQGNAIADYVRTVIESESDSGFGLWRENDKEMAITELSTRANGMFRWVYCQLERLHRCHPAKIRNALDNLPESLDETYRRMLLDLDTESWDYTHRLFQCLAVCREPLSIEDLAEVLAVDFDSSEIPRLVDDLRQSKPEDAILTLCSSFVVVDPERHVQFAHFSVKEFLFSSRLFIDPHPAISRFYLSEKEAHLTLTQACLAVLLTCSDFTEEASLDIVPLASYSTTWWVDHARVEDIALQLRDAMKQIFDPCGGGVIFWGKRFEERVSQHYGIPSLTNTLYYAALAGFHDVVDHLLTTHEDLKSLRGGQYGLPLTAAASQGHINAVRLLLDYGVDIDAQSEEYGSALQAASFGGSLDVVRLLLDHGADVKAQCGKYGSAIQAASASYKPSVDVVRLLLDHGADINAHGGEYGSALQAASFHGSLDVVRLLLSHGADCNAQSGHYGSALQAASFPGSPDIVRLLLDHGADINAQGGQYGSALQSASCHRSLDVVRLLLDRGAEINAQGGEYGSALQAASSRGSLDIVRLLLDRGADINAQSDQYESALHIASASTNPCFDVVRLLLDRGAEINAQGETAGSALVAASSVGSLDIVRLLLDHGADVHAQSKKYGSALHAAACSGSLDVVRLLLDYGADIHAQGGEYGSVLSAASLRGSLDVVRLLLDRGADINAQSGQYGSTLQVAAFSGSPDVVRLLLDHEADVNAQGGEYGSALQAASFGKSLEVVRLLLDHGADINAQSGQHGSPLYIASASYDQYVLVVYMVVNGADTKAKGGQYGSAPPATACHRSLDVVRLLLDRGANINAQGGEYGSALQAASFRGSLDVVRLLLNRGANINAQGGEYGSALQAAAYGNSLEVVRLLLDHGADINAQDGQYGSALQAASASSNPCFEVVHLLLERGADINAQGGKYGSALQAASCSGSLDIVRLLLDCGADINAQGGIYGSALQAASFRGTHNTVFRASSHIMDINAQRGQYELPFQLTGTSYDPPLDLVRLLLDHGADINAHGGKHGSALRAACCHGNCNFISLLLEHGADVNVHSGESGCALHTASFYGHLDAVQLLIDHGADVNSHCDKFGTALAAANRDIDDEFHLLMLNIDRNVSRTRKYAVAALLRERGAKLP